MNHTGNRIVGFPVSGYLSAKPCKVSFSKQVHQEKQTCKQHEDSMKELEEKKESLEKLRLKTIEVQREARNEENSLASEENKMKLHYESKIKILDIKVCNFIAHCTVIFLITIFTSESLFIRLLHQGICRRCVYVFSFISVT